MPSFTRTGIATRREIEMGRTFVFCLVIDAERYVTEEELGLAVYRAIEYALDNDVEGAEVLNRGDVGRVSVG